MKLLDKALCLAAFLGFAACAGNPYPGGEEIDNPGDNPGTGQEGLYLNVSASYIEVGEEVILTVTNDGTDVTADAAIYERTNNYARLEPGADGRYTFSSDEVGQHEFFASYGNRNTDYITVSVVNSILEVPEDPEPDRYDGFTHRALAIQGTSLGCTYCPRVIAGIHDFVESSDADKVVFTAAHGVFADPFVSDYSMQVLLALVENARPENATYRYNYVYDNCATRPRDIIENVLGDRLHYGAMHDTLTFRQEMRRYNANYAWQQFGIDLVLGSGIDYTLSYREQMFVPMVLMQAFAEAQVERDGRLEPLVSATHVLNDGSDMGDILPPTPAWQSPMAVAMSVLVVVLILSWLDVQRRKVSRWADSLLFGMAGVAGLLVFFLIFVSTHEATSPNYNGFWLHPFALLPAVAIWIKKAKKVLYFYHFANFAVVFVLLACWPLLPQTANAAAFPLMLCLMARSASYILVYREQCKTSHLNISK